MKKLRLIPLLMIFTVVLLTVKSDDLFGAHRFVMDNDGTIEKYKLTFVILLMVNGLKILLFLKRNLLKVKMSLSLRIW